MSLPSGAPASNAVLSWSWINAEGNREYYVNCTNVRINGPADDSVTGQRAVMANMPGSPRIGQWIYGDGDGGHKCYTQSKIITIPQGTHQRNDERVHDNF